MKINENYVLQEVADEYIVVPVGEAAERLRGIIKLNKSGAILWKKMEEKDLSQEELVQVLLTEFPTDIKIARKDVSLFIKQLFEMGCLV